MSIQLRRGTLLRHHGHLYFVESVNEHHSGQQRPAVHVTLREAMEGRHIERTMDELLPIEEVACMYRPMQFLYARGPVCVFMDSQSFDEVELQGPVLGGLEPFFKNGEEYRVLYAGEQALRVETMDSVVLKVVDTAAPGHAVGSAGNVMKEARLENGLMVRVPLFIKTGDMIRVGTHDRQYQGKAQG